MRARKTGFIALLLCACAAYGQVPVYPDRPVRIVVGFAAGGPTDIVTRALTNRLSAGLGQPVVVDNRAGAGGMIAAEHVAKSPADGHTLLMGTIGGLAVSMSLVRERGYDTLRDFAPVTQAVTVTNIMVVNPSVPAKTVAEFLALARANPGKLNYASSGQGTVTHLAGELLKSMAGVNLVHVPYKGGAPAMTAILRGEVDMSFENSLVILPQIKAGKVIALAVTGARRSALLPELPTIAEAGLPGYEASGWYGLVAPIATPAAIVARLHAETANALRAPEVAERLVSQGAEPVGSTPAEFGAFMQAEIERWGKVVRSAGIAVQ